MESGTPRRPEEALGGLLRGKGGRRAGHGDGDEVGAVSHFDEEDGSELRTPLDSPAKVSA
jgi:hypothetical protein